MVAPGSAVLTQDRRTAPVALTALAVAGATRWEAHRCRTLYGVTTTRLEMRVPSERAELIRQAAAARGESVTGFVLDAATRAAEAELAIARETLVPVDFFDELLAALDGDPESPIELEELARQPRAFARG